MRLHDKSYELKYIIFQNDSSMTPKRLPWGTVAHLFELPCFQTSEECPSVLLKCAITHEYIDLKIFLHQAMFEDHISKILSDISHIDLKFVCTAIQIIFFLQSLTYSTFKFLTIEVCWRDLQLISTHESPHTYIHLFNSCRI